MTKLSLTDRVISFTLKCSRVKVFRSTPDPSPPTVVVLFVVVVVVLEGACGSALSLSLSLSHTLSLSLSLSNVYAREKERDPLFSGTHAARLFYLIKKSSAQTTADVRRPQTWQV